MGEGGKYSLSLLVEEVWSHTGASNFLTGCHHLSRQPVLSRVRKFVIFLYSSGQLTLPSLLPAESPAGSEIQFRTALPIFQFISFLPCLLPELFPKTAYKSLKRSWNSNLEQQWSSEVVNNTHKLKPANRMSHVVSCQGAWRLSTSSNWPCAGCW